MGECPSRRCADHLFLSLPTANVVSKCYTIFACLGAPHVTTEEDVYMGYHIPKGALVMPILWLANKLRTSDSNRLIPFSGRWRMTLKFITIHSTSNLNGSWMSMDANQNRTLGTSPSGSDAGKVSQT